MSGTKPKTRTESRGHSPSKRGSRKNKKATELEPGPEETHTCKLCEQVFTDKNDKMLQCERCEMWVRLTCTTYTEVENKVLADRAEFHWFCQSCERAALQAVRVDQEIEEKCAAYMSQVTTRIENLERDKADKQTVDELRAKIEELTAENIPQNHARAHSISQEEVTRVVREELAEKELIEAKKLYLILQNIPEYDQEEDQPKSDSQKVQELLE